MKALSKYHIKEPEIPSFCCNCQLNRCIIEFTLDTERTNIVLERLNLEGLSRCVRISRLSSFLVRRIQILSFSFLLCDSKKGDQE